MQVEAQETQTQILGFVSCSHQDTDSQQTVESHKGAVRQWFITDISAFAKRFPLNPRTRHERVSLWPACLPTTAPNPTALGAVRGTPGSSAPMRDFKAHLPLWAGRWRGALCWGFLPGTYPGTHINLGDCFGHQSSAAACLHSHTRPQCIGLSPWLPLLLRSGQWHSTLTRRCVNRCRG